MDRADVETRFDAILREHGALLRNAIARACPKDLGIQIEDVEQEARLRLWRALEREREIHDSASYLYRIAATATIDAVRRVKARREEQLRVAGEESEDEPTMGISVAAVGRSPEHAAEQTELVERVREAIASLPDNRRRCVGLHLEGMTTQEIAGLLGWSEPKARNLVYRGLNDLRKALRAKGIDYDAE